MQESARKKEAHQDIERLAVVKNFRKVIETRDMSLMSKELYQFLNLYCGFIAHYDIHGFRATYAGAREFAEVFIRHFDRNHRYFCGNYPCHDEPYQATGFTKAAIKEEFFRIVEGHKEDITEWADGVERDKRRAIFRTLKHEFEPDEMNLHLECTLCGEELDFCIKRNGRDEKALETLCCLFCGEPIKLHEQGGDTYVEHTIEGTAGEDTETL